MKNVPYYGVVTITAKVLILASVIAMAGMITTVFLEDKYLLALPIVIFSSLLLILIAAIVHMIADYIWRKW